MDRFTRNIFFRKVYKAKVSILPIFILDCGITFLRDISSFKTQFSGCLYDVFYIVVVVLLLIVLVVIINKSNIRIVKSDNNNNRNVDYSYYFSKRTVLAITAMTNRACTYFSLTQREMANAYTYIYIYIWRQNTVSILVQIMVCWLTVRIHYLNQCWLIICKVQGHLSEGPWTSVIRIRLTLIYPTFHSNLPGANVQNNFINNNVTSFFSTCGTPTVDSI